MSMPTTSTEMTDYLDELDEVSPSVLVEGANAETAEQIYDFLFELLSADDVPEDMRVDLRSRLDSLARRFDL